MTIQNAPGQYFSAQSDLIFVVADPAKTSDPVTYPDYRFIADVYINAELVARLKAYPRPDNKFGIFNIANIVRNYLELNFSPNFSTILAQTLADGSFSVNATVKFGEEYGFTLYTNILVDSVRTYFNNYNGRLLGTLTNLTVFQNKVASLRPLTASVLITENYCFLPYYYNSSTISVSIKSYSDAGVLQATHTYAPGAPGSDSMMMMNVAPGKLNNAYPGFIGGIVSYYTVQIGSGAIYRFNLNCEAKHRVYTIHFLNRFGGFESRDFTKVSRKTINIERSEYGKLGYTLDSSGVVSYKNSNNVYNEQRSVFAVQYSEKMTLNTDILSDSEYSWLSDLILSPIVYIEMDGYFVPCFITQNDYEFKKAVNDQLTNLTMNIEFSEQYNAQYQ